MRARRVKMPRRTFAAHASLEQPPLDWLVQRGYVSQAQADKANRDWYTTGLRYSYVEAAIEYAYEQSTGGEADNADAYNDRDRYDQFAYTGRKRGDKDVLAAVFV